MGFWKEFFSTEEEQKKYSIDAMCFNCKKNQTIELPFKKTVKEELEEVVCFNCGNTFLVQINYSTVQAINGLAVETKNLIAEESISKKQRKKLLGDDGKTD